MVGTCETTERTDFIRRCRNSFQGRDLVINGHSGQPGLVVEQAEGTRGAVRWEELHSMSGTCQRARAPQGRQAVTPQLAVSLRLGWGQVPAALVLVATEAAGSRAGLQLLCAPHQQEQPGPGPARQGHQHLVTGNLWAAPSPSPRLCLVSMESQALCSACVLLCEASA